LLGSCCSPTVMNRLRRQQSTGLDRRQGTPILRRSLWPNFLLSVALTLSVATISLLTLNGRGESPATGSAPISSSFPGVIHRSFHDRQLLLTCCSTWPRRSAEPVRRPRAMGVQSLRGIVVASDRYASTVCATSRPSTPSCDRWRLVAVRLGSGAGRYRPPHRWTSCSMSA
jgi:hypothetical protein